MARGETKRAHRARKAREWRDALREYRVLRFDGGAWFKSYLTAVEAAEACARYRAEGLTCEVITDYSEDV